MLRNLLLFLAISLSALAGPADPPPVPREFRAMWIATVGNIDWPSKPGLPVERQQAELRALLDTAKRLNLNAVIFQVRTSCDALYESPFEPWSEYITGRMGVAPVPAWDPLQFAVSEAHLRGLELHAWFNPYRARYHQAISPVSANHVSKTRPELVLNYGRFLWLDPALPESRELTVKVISDVVKRYDVDGIHIDDYFYPYPERVIPDGPPAAPQIPFPDSKTFNKYQRTGGKLALADWRRENVNTLVRELGSAVHQQKSWVKFGISPFGIWRPGFPAGIKGMDQHETLYADARKWIREGMADYFAPQLYWTEKMEGQRFSKLLAWWSGENVSGKHLWPGINAADIGKNRTAADISWQAERISDDKAVNGLICWNASALQDNKGGIANLLARGAFSQPALVPASPWLGSAQLSPPTLDLRNLARGPITVDFTPAAGETPAMVVAQSRHETGWFTQLLPGGIRNVQIPRSQRGKPPAEIRITLISRTGVEGTPSVWVPTN